MTGQSLPWTLYLFKKHKLQRVKNSLSLFTTVQSSCIYFALEMFPTSHICTSTFRNIRDGICKHLKKNYIFTPPFTSIDLVPMSIGAFGVFQRIHNILQFTISKQSHFLWLKLKGAKYLGLRIQRNYSTTKFKFNFSIVYFSCMWKERPTRLFVISLIPLYISAGDGKGIFRHHIIHKRNWALF